MTTSTTDPNIFVLGDNKMSPLGKLGSRIDCEINGRGNGNFNSQDAI